MTNQVSLSRSPPKNEAYGLTIFNGQDIHKMGADRQRRGTEALRLLYLTSCTRLSAQTWTPALGIRPGSAVGL